MRELLIPLENDGKTPLYEQIYRYIKEEIQEDRILPGEKLPSSRAFAAQLAVSRSTVDLAYDQLRAEGYLESVPQKGYFAGDISELYRSDSIKPVKMDTAPPPSEQVRYDFSANGIETGGFPVKTWRRISRRLVSETEDVLLRQGDPQGEPGLRESIAGYLYAARGVSCQPDQIVMGAGNDILLMLLSVLLGRETAIAMEEYTYLSASRCLKNMGHEVIGVATDRFGISVQELKETDAKAAYIMPAHQFPLGIVMPVNRRHQLLQWALEEEGRYLIEDDYDSEFRYKGRPIPSLMSLDKHDKVIYMGTFSRSLSPAIRISFMVLPQTLLKKYRENGRYFSQTVSRLDQRQLEVFLKEGYFERHLNRRRSVCRNKHELLIRFFKQHPEMGSISGENAGMHFLLELPAGKSEEEFVRKAGDKGIRIRGLREFRLEGDSRKSDGSTKREKEAVLIGYASLSAEELEAALVLLTDASA